MKLIDKVFEDKNKDMLKKMIIERFCPKDLKINGEFGECNCNFENCTKCWKQEYKEEK